MHFTWAHDYEWNETNYQYKRTERSVSKIDKTSPQLSVLPFEALGSVTNIYVKLFLTIESIESRMVKIFK